MSQPTESPDDQLRGIVMASPDGRICYWNPGAEQLFGYSAGQAVGKSLDLIVPEDYRDRHWAGFHRAISTGDCRLDRAATNLPVKCADGTVRVFPGRFVFLTDPRDTVTGALAIYAAPSGSEHAFGPIEPLPRTVPAG
ncbi:MAG: PAS domain S-box protein [Candidatus Dormibacteria bacterium]